MSGPPRSAASPRPASAVPDPLPELAAGLRGGELPLESLLACLERRFAEREPEVQAFEPEAGRFERLRREARELAGRFPRPSGRPPLFGVPVGVKDIFRVAGLPTRAGSRLPPEELAGPEARAVTLLRAAGALVAGKTRTTEFAYFAPGPTRNPRAPGHTPGGSSSGSAAAVAAGLVPLALGTQTIGSVLRPASFCGVVGFKPSYDRISREGVIPLAPSLDHVGLFAAGVAGVELAAAVVCSAWRPTTGLGRPVLGVPEGPYLERASSEGLAHCRRLCRHLEAVGYAVRPVELLAGFDAVEERHRRLLAGEAARVHAAWYARHGSLYHPKTAELIEAGRAVTDAELAAARAGQEALRRELEGAMADAGVDLWLSPAAPGAAPAGLETTGDPVMNLPWTQAGMPAVSLPAGSDTAGLPLGLQVVGRCGADEALTAWARGLEGVLAAMPGGGAER